MHMALARFSSLRLVTWVAPKFHGLDNSNAVAEGKHWYLEEEDDKLWDALCGSDDDDDGSKPLALSENLLEEVSAVPSEDVQEAADVIQTAVIAALAEEGAAPPPQPASQPAPQSAPRSRLSQRPSTKVEPSAQRRNSEPLAYNIVPYLPSIIPFIRELQPKVFGPLPEVERVMLTSEVAF